MITALTRAMPAIRYPTPPLAGDTVRLRPLRADDYDCVKRIRDHPETASWVNSITMPDGETLVRQAEVDRRAGRRLHLAIVRPGGGRLVGEIVLFRRAVQAAEEDIAEIAYAVDPKARGRGIASTAVRMLSAWAFAELGVARLQLAIHPDNAPSRRVAEKAGYLAEGTLRSLKVIRGARVDCVIYSRLPSDPAPYAG